MTSMPSILDSTHHRVDGRMGDAGATGGTTSPTGPHQTAAPDSAIVAGAQRPDRRRSATGYRTPVPLLAVFGDPHPRRQDAPPRPSPWNTSAVRCLRGRQAGDVALIAGGGVGVSAGVPAWGGGGPAPPFRAGR